MLNWNNFESEISQRTEHIINMWSGGDSTKIDYPKFNDQIIGNFQKGLIDEITFEKAYNKINELFIKGKDISKLTKKIIFVNRGGKTFQLTTYIGSDEKEVETPIGEELSPLVKGLTIKKYSDRAIIITGDTYVNLDLMRKIKEETRFDCKS